jgi:hypothetical protein
MARRPVPDPEWPAILEAIITDTTGVFAAVEERLVHTVARELRVLDLSENQARLDSLARLRLAGEDAAREVREETGPLAEKVISRALTSGESFAEAWVRSLLGAVPGTQLVHGALASALLVQDLHNRFDDVTKRILRWPEDVYRDVISKTTPGLLLGMDTGRQAQARAWRELRRRGVTGFVDKADRRWNLATYVEMATRTASHRAFTDSNLATLGSFGIDLVTAVGGKGQCEACGRWVGQVMSQTGTGARVLQAEHSTRDGVYVTVRVKGSVDDAIADGFMHPNCRHTLVGYFPGLNNDTGEPWTQEAEDAQAGLRALEVEVRKAKRDLAGALNTDEEKAARRRVREMQARIREHIDETGEPRRREREQLNYGHRMGAR